jgi:hypothetical protein
LSIINISKERNTADDANAELMVGCSILAVEWRSPTTKRGKDRVRKKKEKIKLM